MGDVYVTDGQTGTIEECYVTNHIVETLIPGLSKPLGAAVDNVGNVYTTDTGANLALEWSANTGALGQLSIDGLNHPTGVAVDVAGNVYIANANTTLYELSPSNDRTILVSQPTLTIGGVAVDGSGNAYMASGTILERSYLNTNLATLVAIGLNGAQGVAVNPSGDLFIADTGHEAIKELPRAFIDPTSKLEGLGSGSDTLPAVVSATTNLLATLPPTSDSAWLTITGVTNGLVSYSFTSTATNRTGHINLLGQAVSITQGEPAFALGTSSIVETSGEGSDSVVLAADSGPYPWTATDNDSWLHVSPGFQSGNVATNVIFSFDENTGATRTGTLTIAGQTLTVTQAGSSYLPAGALTTLCSGNEPDDVAVDTNGNVYFANFGDNSISEWNPVTDKVTKVITSGLGGPEGIASDGMGNIYIDDSYGASIYELIGGSAPLTTLVKSPTIFPNSLAVDNNGNIYYFNVNGPVNPGINSRTASTGALIFLPGFSTHALAVAGVAVDRAGNLYVGEGPILRSSGITSSTNWTPAVEPAVTTLVTAASNSWWLTVDGSGNIYSTSSGNPSTVYKWSAASNIVTTLAPSGLGFLGGITVDALGNLYANTGSNPVVELPQAFVDPTPKVEGPAGGSDSLPPVLPLTENLRPPFAPTSDQSWLTITDVTNGVVSFSFTANTGPARSANINLLGQEISVTQTGTGSSAPTFTGVQILGDGGIELHGITTGTSSTFTVLTSTDMALPLNEWTVCGTITNGVTGPFQFTPPPATNDLQRFYVIRSP
jgi:streptogramin lyase